MDARKYQEIARIRRDEAKTAFLTNDLSLQLIAAIEAISCILCAYQKPGIDIQDRLASILKNIDTIKHTLSSDDKELLDDCLGYMQNAVGNTINMRDMQALLETRATLTNERIIKLRLEAQKHFGYDKARHRYVDDSHSNETQNTTIDHTTNSSAIHLDIDKAARILEERIRTAYAYPLSSDDHDQALIYISKEIMLALDKICAIYLNNPAIDTTTNLERLEKYELSEEDIKLMHHAYNALIEITAKFSHNSSQQDEASLMINKVSAILERRIKSMQDHNKSNSSKLY